MKPIVIVTDIIRYHPARIGGGESYVRRLINACKILNINISVYVIGAFDGVLEEEKSYELHYFFNSIDELVLRIREENAVVILFNLPLLTKLRFWSFNSLFLLSLFYPANRRVALFRLLETFLFRYRAILVPSVKMESFYSRFFRRVAVLPPIIPSEFDITNFESRVNVGFIGRLDPRKGGRKLIDFMIQNPELNFDVSYIKHEGDLGVLELEEELTKLCKNSSLVPQGMYTRKVDTDVVKNLNKSAIFLQFYETLDSTVDLPLLLLEALACGCKVYTNVYFKELDEHSLLISMSHKSSEGIVSQEEINETTLDMRLESSSFVRSRFHYVRIMKILIGELYA